MGKDLTHFWVRISVFNLAIVALLGVLMRYKISFDLPWIDQRHLQHAHSHFAFSGWVSQVLMVCMMGVLKLARSDRRARFYQIILWCNLISAYGMVVSFALQGYGAISIVFSTLSIIVSFVFSYRFYLDLKESKMSLPGKPWFCAALLFGVVSTLGTFALIYMMATHHIPQTAYLSSVYWFLHFHYNGWFFFACMGLLMTLLNNNQMEVKQSRLIFHLFVWSCFPTFGLSVLWMNLPVYLYIVVVLGAIAQMCGWIILLRQFFTSGWWRGLRFLSTGSYLLTFAASALTIKMALQLGSTIPQLSKLAFGFRTVVIAYLHLVLLAVITVFLLGYVYAAGYILKNAGTRATLIIFTIGVFLNELVLAAQGIASFSYLALPGMNESLVIISAIMLISLVFLFVFNLKQERSAQ